MKKPDPKTTSQKALETRTSSKYEECICPLCGKVHQVFMFWTGRGKPRKYCSRCERVSADLIRYDQHPHTLRLEDIRT